jgi:hypothetical protein
MKTFLDRHKELEGKLAQRIKTLIDRKGKPSKHTGELVLVIKDDNLMFNLDGGRYLTEISKNVLIDNEGYQYWYSCLTLEQLCEVVDSFK